MGTYISSCEGSKERQTNSRAPPFVMRTGASMASMEMLTVWHQFGDAS